MKKELVAGVIISASALLLFGACSKEEVKGKIENGQVTETSTSVELNDGEKADLDAEKVSLKDDGSFKEVVRGKENPKITFEAEYDTNWKDSSWENVDFEIDRAKIVEVDKIKDNEGNEFKGLLAVRYYLENKGDEEVKIHPNKATVILNDGTEIKGDGFIDYWEDVFAKDKKKDGYVHFKFDKLDQIKDIKQIKLTFDGHKKGDDKDKVSHEYNVDLPLTPAE
jgi:hypothetical protein